MKFILTLHKDEHNSIHVVGLSDSIESGMKLYDLIPEEYDLIFIKQYKNLTLSMLGDCLQFEEVEYDDGLLNQYLRKQKLKRIQ